MKGNFEQPWEESLHRALRSLPETKAPRTLLPKIMAAASRSETLAWWQRPLWAWPVPARAGLALLLALAAWAAANLVGGALGLVSFEGVAQFLRPLRPLAAVLDALGRVFWAARAPLGLAVLTLGSLSAGFGTLLYQITSRTPPLSRV